ncbi:MAG: tetratricopeptide repeat protein [Bacteroidota bacterium]
MRKYASYTLLLLILFTASCGLFRKPITSRADPDSAAAERMQLEFQNHFFNGLKEKAIENPVEAEQYFLKALSVDPGSGAVMYELACLYNKSRQYNKAYEYIRKAIKTDGENIWYQIQYTKTLDALRKYDEEADIFEKLLKKNPNRIELYYDWANVLISAKKYNDAIKVYDKIEALSGVQEEISFQKENLYLEMKKTDKAIQEIEKLVKSNPKEPRFYGMLAELYMMDKNEKKALEIYQQVLEMDPDNPLIHIALADYYQNKGEKEKTFEELLKAFSNPELDVDTKMKILLSYYEVSAIDTVYKKQAYKLSEMMIATHPTDAKSYSIHADFLYRDKRYEEARDEFKNVIKYDSSKFAVWEQLMIIEADLMDYAALEKTSMSAIELFPIQATPYLFNGVANIKLKDFQSAIEVLNMGKDLVADNKLILAEFYSNLGDAYHYKKNDAYSDDAYDKSLALNPKNPYLLNNYSFYLSLRGEKLDKAESMAKSANEMNPNNSSFLDTWAWVLYKQKKYEEAKKIMNKALQNGGSKSAAVLEHYGDILFQLGEKENAIENWKKAKEKGNGSEFLDKKITQEKLIE